MGGRGLEDGAGGTVIRALFTGFIYLARAFDEYTKYFDYQICIYVPCELG
jgi:hypothetical protein